MNNENSSYIKISSMFTRNVIILFAIIFIVNIIMLHSVFINNSQLKINKYNEIIDKAIKYKDNSIFLDEKGKKLLSKNNLWFQMIDNSLKEVSSYNKPLEVPSSYSPINLIHSYKYDIANSSVFIFEKQIMGKKYSYLLGFPLEVVSKYNIQYNTSALENLLHGKFIFILLINIIIIILFSYFCFSKKIVQPLQKIIDSIVIISKGKYNLNIQEKGLYKPIYACLNKLSTALNKSKLEKDLLDKSREKWTSYISHDIKTPLSSIKGFTEIMKDSEYTFTEEEIKKYSSIMYDKAVYIEELVQDLNLIHKLKNSAIHLNYEKINIVQFVIEMKKEILSSPNFFNRKIKFTSYSDVLYINADAKLLRRSLSNFLINFLIYNDDDTNICIDIIKNNTDIDIVIKDNGRGINPDELPHIFEQYYRGTNTNTNSNGSGLGMAIAYEIIKLHKGNCNIKSKIGIGTTLVISIPSFTNH
ncbi:sensor histidine kinase [Haloimpatiens sp. FM7330]|uniref:sensor histidine kinase n=1 Tax=Haloimpatiens sp. FM7330 TaxID=3298610 RepID=UPI003630F56D